MTLTVKDVRVYAHDRLVVEGVSFTSAPGEVCTIMGPSGSGKSAILAHVAGIVPTGLQVTGVVSVSGQRLDQLPAEQRRLGMLSQQPTLFPHLSVIENILFAVPRYAGSRKQRLQMAQQALADVELAAYAAAHPEQLSGGQQARVALARCLAADPQALLLDEPFGALDVALRQRMRELVFDRARRAGLPVVLVTHDPEDATAAAGPVMQLGKVTTNVETSVRYI